MTLNGETRTASEPSLEMRTSVDGIDPFYLYLDLVERFGVGHVFLLDAAKDHAAPQYQKSILGIGPVLEVMVKDHDVIVTAVPGLFEYVHDTLMDGKAWSTIEATCLDGTTSVIEGACLRYRASDPMALLEQLRLGLQGLFGPESGVPFSSGFLGYIGYDAVQYLEALPKTTSDDRHLPDIRLQWHSTIIHLTGPRIQQFHAANALEAVVTPEICSRLQRQEAEIGDVLADGSVAPDQVPGLLASAMDSADGEPQVMQGQEDVTQARYEDNVRRAIEYIRAGDIFQVVLSKRVRVAKRLHHYVAYDRLRRLNPSPYMFMSEYPDMRLFGTSPEVQFRVVDGIAEMRPIAGTSKGRGATPAEDEALVQRLLHDEKEQAEHVMLVDLCRNDLGRVCKIDTVRVPEYLVAERYSHVIHLVSSVRGAVRSDVSVFHALLATFPAGTLSGAPKIRAMEIIDELEDVSRGPYGGMMGMIDFDANANTAIIIRSVIETQGEYFVQAGAGIVADSDPTQEWLECGRKSGAMLDVLLKPSLVK